jgi:TRAP-type C4-dicarboxylate transport system permease small subunit
VTNGTVTPADGGRIPAAVRRFMRLVGFVASSCLAFVVALTFVSVALRYLFVIQVPDNYDFARLVSGIFIFWGIAAIGYQGEHIQMDAIWSLLGERGKRALDIFATAVSLGFIGLLAVLVFDRVAEDIAGHTETLNLSIEIWPFHLAAAVGMLAAAVLLLLRAVRLILGGTIDAPDASASRG